MSHRLNEPNIWPAPILEGIPLKTIASNYNPASLPYHCYPEEIINYILYVCKKKQLSPRSFEGTLIVSTRYLKQTNRLESVQLICLASLMLVSKLYDYYCLTVGEIHEVSNHEFTNRGNFLVMIEIREMEAKILMALDFNLFTENKKIYEEQNGIQKEIVHYSIYEMLLVILEMTSGLIPKQKQSFYYEITNKIFYLYFHMLYTKEFKARIAEKLCNPKFIICIIIRISLISLTQCNGVFPQIQWIQQILRVKSNQDEKKFDDEFEEFSGKIIHLILGKRFETVKNEIKPFYIRN